MVRETHADEKVAQTLNNSYIPVRLEGRGHMELVQKMGVRGAPTTLIFSPDGQEKHRFTGFQTPEEYLQELAKAA
ncbi:MAG: thioredoxin fold domain-containing protein [Deltaproteobacteria bacterium]|nr:thioredoxin fold domain-containing protein [Deltaproteobacteria bacterium]